MGDDGGEEALIRVLSHQGSAVWEDDGEPELAASKAIRILSRVEKNGELMLERDSVYGSVVAMPQIARSAGWNSTFTAFAARSGLLYMFNLFVQCSMTYMVYLSCTNLAAYSGKMHLCNFGLRHMECPHGQNCYGPGGTVYTPERMYSFETWNIRNYVKNSLKDVFPDKKGLIDDRVDPGDYGIDSGVCRIICGFCFMTVVTGELSKTIELVRLILYIPSRAECWLHYNRPDWETKDQVKKIQNLTELDLVVFRIRGMPCHWKVFNLVFVALPKLVIWKAVTYVGLYFLMETAGILDLIINTTALSFLLNIDELILTNFSSSAMRYMLGRLEGVKLYDTESYEKETDDEALERFRTENPWDMEHVWMIVPKQLILTIVTYAVFMLQYYYTNCNTMSDGSMVSKAVREPDGYYRWWCIFADCTNRHAAISWVMPNVTYPAPAA